MIYGDRDICNAQFEHHDSPPWSSSAPAPTAQRRLGVCQIPAAAVGSLYVRVRIHKRLLGILLSGVVFSPAGAGHCVPVIIIALPFAMTSALPTAFSSGGKALNNSSSSSSHLPAQHHQTQPVAPSFESSSRRSGSHAVPAHGTVRNNQGNRRQHKNSRRPKLADEDAMAESVRVLQNVTDLD
jgi:hypothetical protein